VVAKEEKGLDLVFKEEKVPDLQVKEEKVPDLEVPRDPEERLDRQLDVQPRRWINLMLSSGRRNLSVNSQWSSKERMLTQTNQKESAMG